MAQLSKLTDVECKAATPGDKLSDGGGLRLLVQPSGKKLWQYRYEIQGREGLYSIGLYPDVPLKKAREAHEKARKLVREGRNPTTARNDERAATAQAEQVKKQNTFKSQYDAWLAETRSDLSMTTVTQRVREIANDLPALMSRPLADITRKEIVNILQPVVQRAPEVAKNLRQYINEIFERAILHEIVDGNPTPPSSMMNRRRQAQHHAALLDDDLGELLHAMATDGRSEPKSVLATRLAMLTACRKSEVCGAQWSEFNLKKRTWLIPAERMKLRVEHWVPLSTQAVALLRAWKESQGTANPLLFPNRRDPKRPMAGRTLNALFGRLGFGGEGTPHGMRAGFSTHFNSQGDKHKDVVERCLAHVPKNEVRAAYNRYKYRNERTAMLQAWADHLEQSQARASEADAANAEAVD